MGAFRPMFGPLQDEEEENLPRNGTETVSLVGLNEITEELNRFIDTMAILNTKMKYVQGFRVQVYSGRSREEANRAKEKVYSINPDAKIFTEYKQPYFKVKVGNFVERLEAQSTFADLKNEFEGVIVVPDQIEIGN